MKRILLSVLATAFAYGAFAQASGIAVSPVGATASDQITITVFPDQTCTPNNDPLKSLSAATVVRIHGGVNIGGTRWQNVQAAGPGDPTAQLAEFVQQPNGTWTKTITPTDYFQVPAGTAVEEMNFVLNGGPDGANWDREGKFDNAGMCEDFHVPFPIAAPFVGIRKQVNNSVFTVRANRPNPVTGSTTISFFLNKAEKVNVRVTNILGETVKVLANNVMNAGEQQLTWNAAGATPGIYFYTVEAGGATESRKMMVK